MTARKGVQEILAYSSVNVDREKSIGSQLSVVLSCQDYGTTKGQKRLEQRISRREGKMRAMTLTVR